MLDKLITLIVPLIVLGGFLVLFAQSFRWALNSFHAALGG